MLYHMMAGMMQVVSVMPDSAGARRRDEQLRHLQHQGMDHSGHGETDQSNHQMMDHGEMDHSMHQPDPPMDHSQHGNMDHSGHDMHTPEPEAAPTRNDHHGGHH